MRLPSPSLVLLLSTVTVGCQGSGRVQLTLRDGTCGRGETSAVVRVLRVTGPGLETSERVLRREGGQGSVGLDVPAGKDRVLTLLGYDDDPNAGGRLVVFGRTPPLSVEPGVERETSLTLRPPNAFVPVCDAGGGPLSLSSARAAHTATLVEDGRLLLAGGYHLVDGGQALATDTTEWLDLASLGVSEGPSIPPGSSGGLTGRAFHSATYLGPGAKLLLGGGETGSAALQDGALLDERGTSFQSVPLAAPRSRHLAARLDTATVVLASGISTGAMALELPEALTPPGFEPKVATEPAGAAESAGAVAQGRWVLAGGRRTSGPLRDIWVLSVESERPRLVESGLLSIARRGAVMATLGDAGPVLVLGGWPAEVNLAPLERTELIHLSTPVTVSPGPLTTARAGGCGVTLHDGRVLWVGGQRSGGQSSGAVELMGLEADGVLSVERLGDLTPARHDHSCTLLPDGAVLVTGGIRQTASAGQTLADAHILMPAPSDR